MVKYKEKFLEMKSRLEAVKASGSGDAFSKMIESVVGNSNEIAEVAIYGALAMLGKQVGLGYLYPIVALKLATTPVGDSQVKVGLLGVEVPLNSQTIGIAMLGILGLAPLVEGMANKAQDERIKLFNLIEDCEEKRSFANYARWGMGWDLPEIRGWFDTGAIWARKKGDKYLQCVASSDAGKDELEEEKKEAERDPDYSKKCKFEIKLHDANRWVTRDEGRCSRIRRLYPNTDDINTRVIEVISG